jgi:hypothetical protein
MTNAAQRKSIREAEKFAAETERARVEFVVAAMDTKQGRAWFHNILSVCGIFDGSFSGDALLEAFTKGQRNIGLMIYNDIVTHCPDQFVQMMREATIQEIVYDRRTDASDDDDDDDSADAELG